jgi:hypothetical protein
METNNIDYQSSVIEVIDVSVEKGFADSAEDFGDETW